MDLEAMEDGYVARILKPEGAQDVNVGEVRKAPFTLLSSLPGLTANWAHFQTQASSTVHQQ